VSADDAGTTWALERLRHRVEERWRVVHTKEGFVLVPRRSSSQVRGLEFDGDRIYADGELVTEAELRVRLGGDADAVLALSRVEEATRRQIFTRPPVGSRAPDATVAVTGGSDPEDSSSRRRRDRVRIGGDLVIGEHERAGDAVVILGSVRVDGEVDGDVVAVGGGASLGPRAVVRGEVVTVGGRIDADPGARVLGGTSEIALGWSDLQAEAGRVVRVWPDPAWWARAALVGVTVRLGLIGLFGLIAVVVGGRVFARASQQIGATPWQALLVGAGAQVVLLPLLLLVSAALLLSIVGIPLLALVPIGVLVGGWLWLVGYAAAAERLGQRLLRPIRTTSASPILAFLVGFGVVAVPIWFVRLAWWLGWIGGGPAITLAMAGALVEGAIWSAGLGALVLGWIGQRRTPAAAPAPPPWSDVSEGPAVP
jgi:hypothetical protein